VASAIAVLALGVLRSLISNNARFVITSAVALPVVLVTLVFLLRYTRREHRRAELLGDKPVAEGDAHNASNYHVLANTYFERDESTRQRFPNIRVRRTISGAIGGHLATGRLEIRGDGIFFRVRGFWPMSLGVRGSLLIPWNQVRSVDVVDPVSGRTGALGGSLIVDVVPPDGAAVSFEFLGSQLAVSNALSRVGAPKA
jgi:hypothetical protein